MHLNDVPVGETPVEVGYTYAGVYDIRLRAPSYESLVTRADTGVGYWEWPVVDLAFAAVPPGERRVVRWHFVLERAEEDPAGLLDRARGLRSEVGGFEEGAAVDGEAEGGGVEGDGGSGGVGGGGAASGEGEGAEGSLLGSGAR